jgi:diguanylate cyclase (GGDEF)-like protein
VSRETKKILVIDDSPVILRLVEARLKVDYFQVITAGNGEEGLRLAAVEQPHVILLDLEMHGTDGTEVLRRLKNGQNTKLIPVIVLTADTRVERKVQGFELGALDYVTKPFDPVELRARVRSAHRLKYMFDLLEQKAQIDGLTGLYNRAYLDRRLGEEYERTVRYGGKLGVVMFDIDKFKSINDTYGHALGDQVIAEVAEAARSLMRKSDIVARYGGEEFVAILPETDTTGSALFAERLRSRIEGQIEIEVGGKKVRVSASFGAASCSDAGHTTGKELLDLADQALYHAKRTGRNRVCTVSMLSAVPSESPEALVGAAG